MKAMISPASVAGEKRAKKGPSTSLILADKTARAPGPEARRDHGDFPGELRFPSDAAGWPLG